MGKGVSVPRRAAVGKDQQPLAWRLEIPDKKDFLGFFPTKKGVSLGPQIHLARAPRSVVRHPADVSWPYLIYQRNPLPLILNPALGPESSQPT